MICAHARRATTTTESRKAKSVRLHTVMRKVDVSLPAQIVQSCATMGKQLMLMPLSWLSLQHTGVLALVRSIIVNDNLSSNTISTYQFPPLPAPSALMGVHPRPTGILRSFTTSSSKLASDRADWASGSLAGWTVLQHCMRSALHEPLSRAASLDIELEPDGRA